MAWGQENGAESPCRLLPRISRHATFTFVFQGDFVSSALQRRKRVPNPPQAG
jgi:hypothetical protein